MNDKLIYSIDEVASILMVTRRTVSEYIKQGKLQSVKIGKYRRISKEALQDFLSQGTKPENR